MVILFAWELGGGLGHLARHLELARALAARKHQVLFAVKDLAQAQTLLKESGFGYFQSPQLARAQTLQRPMCSFADVLAFHGMADADTGTPLLHVR